MSTETPDSNHSPAGSVAATLRSNAAGDAAVACLHQGDNLALLANWPTASIDLIYIDPPFNTGRTQHGRPRDHHPSASPGAFGDTWSSITEYLDFMRPRLEHMHRLLRPSGSLLLHCDWRTCHHLRLLLDDIFGADRFVNHLIWAYGLGGSSPRRFARKHDDILFYGRTAEYHFEPPRVPATSRRMQGQVKKATDVLDVPALNNMARERTGYPTQKPLALLTLLVDACCPPGPQTVVADFFCGSGTTLVAVCAVGRGLAIGCDLSPAAIAITRQRLEAAGVPVRLIDSAAAALHLAAGRTPGTDGPSRLS